MGELIDLGVKANIVEKSGAWFSYNSQRLGQGRDNAKTFLKANPAIAQEIEDKIRHDSGISSAMLGVAEDDADGTEPTDD